MLFLAMANFFVENCQEAGSASRIVGKEICTDTPGEGATVTVNLPTDVNGQFVGDLLVLQLI